MEYTDLINKEPIQKLTKDIKNAAKILTKQEARYLVDTYYQIQDYRKATSSQCRVMSTTGEPHDLFRWLLENIEILESQIKSALKAYTDNQEVGVWLKSNLGIGPVLAAGLLAHIDITKAQTAGAIWRYAGLDPSAVWKKGEIRPWNAKLKQICWKIGQSFVKVSNNPSSIYGKLYKERKELEQSKNEKGEYETQAKSILINKKIGKNTEAYKWYSKGKLPPAHIQQRAERYAVKIFLSHLHQFWYKKHFGVDAPKPYPIAILGHAHMIDMPEYEE